MLLLASFSLCRLHAAAMQNPLDPHLPHQQQKPRQFQWTTTTTTTMKKIAHTFYSFFTFHRYDKSEAICHMRRNHTPSKQRRTTFVSVRRTCFSRPFLAKPKRRKKKNKQNKHKQTEFNQQTKNNINVIR